MSETNKNAFQAGQAAGKTEEKGNVMVEKVKAAAAGAGASAQQAGTNISNAAGNAVNAVKDKTGMNNMSDNKNAFEAGQAAGKTEEKGNVMVENVKAAVAGAGASAQQAGAYISEAAGGAVNVIMEKTGMNK